MTQARYDDVADFYTSGFDSTGDPATQGLLDLLGPVAGLRVLDVACGHGRITRELARRGALAVGIDISGQLIRKARQNEQNEPLGLRYLHADIAAPGVLGDDDFDVATCNFGLSDIDDLDAAITAVSAALRPRGCFVFSILHPCFAGGKDISGAWPADGSYYGEGHWTAGGSQIRATPPGRRQPPDAVDLSQHAAASRPVAGPGHRTASGARLGPGPRC